MKKLLCLFHLVCFSLSAQEAVKADTLLSYGKTYIGTKYKYGSIDPKTGFDCSGFIYHVFQHFKIKVPRASMDYEKAGKIISPDSCQPGDVIVFTGTNIKNRKPGHVGLILSKPGDEISFMHSSSGKYHNGVIITSYKDSPYYKKRFIKIVRMDAVQQ